MAEVNCPVESDCGYTGSVGSVEAHISGSQQGDHKGAVGRHHREELVDQAEDTGPTSLGDTGRGSSGSTGLDRKNDPDQNGSSIVADSSFPPGRAVLFATVALVLVTVATTGPTGSTGEGSEGSEETAETEGETTPGGLLQA